MSTLSWNCRGIGNPRAIRELLVSSNNRFIFFMETKVRCFQAKNLRVKIGFNGLFFVDGCGLAGGIALLWKNHNNARLISYSSIDIEINIRNKG